VRATVGTETTFKPLYLIWSFLLHDTVLKFITGEKFSNINYLPLVPVLLLLNVCLMLSFKTVTDQPHGAETLKS
jgi:hypothetical protein